MSIKIKFEKLPTQAKVFDDDATEIIMQSQGLGGGKTYNLCMKLLKLSAQNKNMAGGILAPSYRDFRRDILPTFEDILDSHKIKFRYHKSEQWFKFPWSKGKLYVFTAEKSIAGPNLAYCGINEFSLISFERVNEMLRRVRVKNAPNPQRILVGTPEDIHGWLEEFIESQEKRGKDKFKIHYGKTSENIHIDESYTQLLESMLDEASLEVFRDGKIGRLGSDYFYYSFSKEKNVSKIATYNKDLIIHCGLDFNVGKMAASFSHKIKDEQHFFDELFLRGNSNTYTMAKAIKELYPLDRIVITCDAAGNARTSKTKEQVMTDVKILRDEGFQVRFKSQNPRLRKRQTMMNGMLHHGKILVHPKCKTLINDLKNTRQKIDFTKDEGKDGLLSHMSDGADYVCDFEHGKKYDGIRIGSQWR